MRHRLAVVVHRLDVLELLDTRERVVGHAEFFALVDVRRALMQVEHGGEQLRRPHPELTVVAEPADHARLVMVVPVEAVPADVAQPDLPAPERRLQRAQVEGKNVPLGRPLVDADVLELEDHVDLGPAGIGEEPGLLDRDAGHLTDREEQARATGEDLLVHLVQELVDPRPADEILGPVTERAAGRPAAAVGQLRVLGDHVDDVHPEAVHPAVQPPAHHRVDGITDPRVLPVQVRLLAGEQVQVVLAGGLVQLPCRSGEERRPVGRFGTWVAGVHALTRRAPPKPLTLGVLLRRAALDEPGVLVGGVVDHQVQDQLDAPLVQALDQLVEVGERAEHRVDVLVVADVVAVVVHR
jgi:hypothetical protein